MYIYIRACTGRHASSRVEKDIAIPAGTTIYVQILVSICIECVCVYTYVHRFIHINHLVWLLVLAHVYRLRTMLLSQKHTPVSTITIGTEPFQASLQAGASFEDEAEMPAVAAQFNADEMPNSWRMHV